MNNIIWKPIFINNNPTNYEVSNTGLVRNIQTDTIVNSVTDHSGFKFVNLIINKKYKRCRIHHLVANAFILNPNNYKMINHIDGNKTNNKVSNLEWASPAKIFKVTLNNL